MQPVLFTAACILFGCTGSFWAMSFSHEEDRRSFHYITMFVTGMASLAYLAMAFNGGALELELSDGSVRKFFWIRYVECVLLRPPAPPRRAVRTAAAQLHPSRTPPSSPPSAVPCSPPLPPGSWLITTPLLLLDIGLLAGAPMYSILYVIGCDVLMILAGVVGPAFFGSNDMAKWIFFAIGNIWFLPILYALAVEWAAKAGTAVKSTYKILAYGTVVLWTAYPFMWFFCEGLGYVSEDTEGETGRTSAAGLSTTLRPIYINIACSQIEMPNAAAWFGQRHRALFDSSVQP
jgi:bacteriorhodopsin